MNNSTSGQTWLFSASQKRLSSYLDVISLMRRTEVKRLRRLNLVLNKTRRFRVYDPSSEPETFLFFKNILHFCYFFTEYHLIVPSKYRRQASQTVFPFNIHLRRFRALFAGISFTSKCKHGQGCIKN